MINGKRKDLSSKTIISSRRFRAPQSKESERKERQKWASLKSSQLFTRPQPVKVEAWPSFMRRKPPLKNPQKVDLVR
jgi:hypothetical protein